ncbi:FAD-dependent oxidoreductase [Thermocrispum municipale]|uniref:FAD-dependent oxidoreductase n=1 Tax=Thermocrispum municipale TaxID=37926 RepID=UPI0004281EA1|nr:FAD-dependent oxidoreductase [Thermocrispum municipale]
MKLTTTVAIVGGGPAGMVLGLLLARAGVEVTVLEKHADFLRDFRGDTVHPSTLTLLDELGLGERFGKLPQSKITEIAFPTEDDDHVVVADLKRLRVRYPYIAMVPQWDLLDLLADAAAEEPGFTLLHNAEVTDVLRAKNGAVNGVRFVDRTTDEERELYATLTVAADGRWSIVRAAAGLPVAEFPVPFDVWWFRLPRYPEDPQTALSPGLQDGEFALAIPREGYYQMAIIGPKGTDERLRAAGIEKFRKRVGKAFPWAAERTGEIASLDDVKHLDVRLNRLKQWHRPGLLCIGDAAHAMSPIGGVGINLAVQDAVAAATLLAKPLREGRLTTADLAKVRRRRWLPTVAVQTMQRTMQQQLVAPVMRGEVAGPPEIAVRLMRRAPWLSYVPARLIGIGFRPEHAPDFARR